MFFALVVSNLGISQMVNAGRAVQNPSAQTAAEPAITIPREGQLIKAGSIRICARGLYNHFRVLAGNRDVTSTFRRKGRLWCARLRRDTHVEVGSNRLVIEYPSSDGPRYIARTFVIGERVPGSLQLIPESLSDSLLHLRIEGPEEPFEAVEIKLNGRRVETADWIVGKRTPSTQWPLGAQGFSAMFGADNGLRHGFNRLKVTAYRKDGSFDTARHKVFIPSSFALVSAGVGGRIPVGRSIALAGSVKRPRRYFHRKKIDLRWEIVDAPEGSTAELSDPQATEPTFVPDVHGSYRFRLIAQVGSRSLRTTMDETTIQAKLSVPPIGAPITTITKDGGILVGDTLYPPEGANPWVQLLVLDRRTLEVISKKTFSASGGTVSLSDVEILEDLVQEQNASHLVVVSGGGRAIQFEQGLPVVDALQNMLDSAGALFEPNSGRLLEHLKRGTWSLIGVPGVAGSGHLNLFGLDYGLNAGDSSEPGALTGYLREDAFDNYGFASAAFDTIDTQASGSTARQNVIEIGSQKYLSGLLGGVGYAGFHVLVLDNRLQMLHNETYQMNQGGTNNAALVNSMRLLLDSVAPGHLVVVQSIGTPFGFGPSWVVDGPLFRNAFGDNYNMIVPRAPSLWYDAAGFGQSLAGVIGSIGGAAAHDHFAALNSEKRTDGYTLIASIGQLDGFGLVTTDLEPVPLDPVSHPVSQVGSIAKSTARVVGTLRRDRRALWHVLTPAESNSFENGAVETVLYQPETAWPLSTNTDDNNANCYIASQLFAGTGLTDVRTAYYEANLTAAEWNSRLPELTALAWNPTATCPSTNQTFTESAFNAVKSQLEIEFSKVADVTSLAADWTAIFGDATTTGYIDLQTIAHTVIGNIERIDTSAQGTVKTEAIISDSLQIAGGLSFGIPPASAAFGAASGVFSLLADTSGNESGRPSLSPLETEVATLGQNLVSRYQEVGSNLRQIQAILVSDWGKLQQADNFTAAWSPNSVKMTSTLTLSSKQEFYSALLPTVYILYYVAPEFIGNKFFPWNLTCQGNGSATHPFGQSNRTPSAWSTPVVISEGPQQPSINFLGINTAAEIDGGQLNRNPDRPDLANMGGDNLFQPLSADVGTALGMNKTTLFADPRFVTRWFWCIEIEN